MMYSRASASDYNDWKYVYGSTGWGATDLLPLFVPKMTISDNPDGNPDRDLPSRTLVNGRREL